MIHIVDHIRPAVYLHVGRYEKFKLSLRAFLHMINVQEFFLPLDFCNYLENLQIIKLSADLFSHLLYG